MEPNSFYIPPRKKFNWLAVDLDGTLAYPTWKAKMPQEVIGDPIPENIEKLMEAVNMGYKIVIHTARSWGAHQLIEEWARSHNIPVAQIQCGKILAHRYIDDRAINARDDRWY